jgi:tellurite resistance protein TehA-like permease
MTGINNKILNLLHILLETFHPLHFVASMGIGITAGIMYTFPIESARFGFKYIGIIYFFINLVVIIITHFLFFLKYILFPKIFKNDKRYSYSLIDLLHKPDLTVFLGASSMSITTMINMLVFMKPNWRIAIFSIWWINFFQAVSCTFIIVFFIMAYPTNKINKSKYERKYDIENKQDKQKKDLVQFPNKPPFSSNLYNIKPALMLPLVTCTVTGASGSLVTQLFIKDYNNLVLMMIIITTMLIAIALLTSFMMLSIIFTRIFSYGLPKHNSSFTMFVPIGVMGQGSLGIMIICKNLSEILNKEGFKIIGLNNINKQFELIITNLILLVGIFSAISLTAFGITLTIWGILAVFYWYIGWPRIHKSLEINQNDDKLIIIKSNQSEDTTILDSINNKEMSIKNKFKSILSKKFRESYVLWTPTMWAATFPFGTIGLAMHELYQLTNLIGFKIVSCIYGFAVIIITTWCMICTLIYIVPWKRMIKEISCNS